MVVSIVFNDSDVFPRDRWFLERITGPEAELCVQRTLDGTRLILYDESIPHVLTLEFVLSQTWLDYARTFGIPQRPGFPRLPEAARSGRQGPDGALIPSNAWLLEVLNGLGPELVDLTVSWSPPVSLIRAVEQGELEGAAALSRIAWEFARFLLGQVPARRPRGRKLRHVGVYVSEAELAWLHAHGGPSRAVRALIDRAVAEGWSPETSEKGG